jgi:hypothetical protein
MREDFSKMGLEKWCADEWLALDFTSTFFYSANCTDGMNQVMEDVNVQFGVVGTTIKAIKGTIHRGWCLHILDLVCSSKGRMENWKSYKQMFWISISYFFALGIRRKEIQEWRG